MKNDNYQKTYTVLWSNLDPNWHVRRSIYGEYATDIIIQYLGEKGFSPATYKELGFAPVVFKEETEYRNEIGWGHGITLDFSLLGLSKDGYRWKVCNQVFRSSDNALAARIFFTGGWLSSKEGKLVLPTLELLQAVEQIPHHQDFVLLPNRGEKNNS